MHAFLAVMRPFPSIAATRAEQVRPMPADGLVPQPMSTITHAITIDAPPERVWSWLAQLGSGRAGWYSWDRIDNGGQPSAERVLAEYQHVAAGDIIPALPGAKDVFVVAAVEPPRDLVLTVPGADGPVMTWEHLVEPIGADRSRLIVRARVARSWQQMARDAHREGQRLAVIEYVYRVLARLPAGLMMGLGGLGHRWMEARHMRGIKRRAESTAPVAERIAEIARLRLGGIEQWVMIRGENIRNPPLILLHGGPGLSETSMFRYYNASLEKDFTVVYWDQRGAGKSFDPGIPRSSMTVEQFITDLDELVDAVCRRVGATKVTILGHSWGSTLGVLYTARFPHKVAAYVGCAQIGDGKVGDALSYEYALATAQRLGHRKALEALRRMGPPPHSAKDLMSERTWVQRLDGQLRPRALWTMARMILGTPESSILELPKAWRAFRFTLDAMWTEVSTLNLLERVPALQVPTFFLLGRQDHWVPAAASVAYIDALTAPSKQVVWFERSGHEPFVDEPAAFNAAMRDLVRPVVAAEAS
jgi:pimeloyl-ACP methyl ester carboxylesterase